MLIPEDLPTGACSSDGAKCRTGIQYYCASGQGRLDALVCSCSSGQWQCVVTGRGAAICTDGLDASG